MEASNLISTTTAALERAFGVEPTLWARAPGRVNLIGEHTDYNDGFVLPCAIDYETVIAARARDDRRVRVVACDYGEAADSFWLDEPIASRTDAMWANYLRGVVQQLLARGLTLRGADLAVAGNVPQGAGLSSSAAFEVAVGQVFKSMNGLDSLSPSDIAVIAQQAENRFVGVNCGIMDQLISARGEAGHALLIDCRSLETRAVPVAAGVSVMIVHSYVRRGLVDSEYNARRQQCEVAARHCGVKALRDLDEAALERRAAGLDPLALRRARHVVSENRRTLAAAQALAANDLRGLGRLMAESHDSMRDDFQITVPAIDRLVEILQEAVGAEGGARMTGGGFGGCCVALLPNARVPAVTEAIARLYRSPEGKAASVYLCHASDGARSETAA